MLVVRMKASQFRAAATRPPSARKRAGFRAFILDRDTRIVNLLAFASLIELVIFKVLTTGSRQLFAHGADLANLASDLAVGYVAAWFFYYLVGWRPRRQDKDLIMLQAGPAAIHVSGTALAILAGLRHSASDTSTGPISVRDLSALAHNLRTTSKAEREKSFVATALLFATYLDSELLTMLTEIDSCSYFQLLSVALRMRADQDLVFIVPSMYEYFVLTDRLSGFVVDRYGTLLNRYKGWNAPAVGEFQAASEPVTWRPGSVSPWEAANEPPPWEGD
jgi:hypothetical protein